MIDFNLPSPSIWLNDLMSVAQLAPHDKEALLDKYGQETRSYHGVWHISFLWYCHVTLRPLLVKHCLGAMSADSPNIIDRVIATLIATHDVEQKPAEPHGTSEKKSAEWYMARRLMPQPGPLMTVGLSEEWHTFIHDAIIASASHVAERPYMTFKDILLHWFLGLDLILLAAPADMFDMHGLMIRGEYHHLTSMGWTTNRKKFMKHFSEAKTIFYHPVLRDLFEDRVRANIKRVTG
jgi:predicted metal-dependent HD superfamily phosphohydrolase